MSTLLICGSRDANFAMTDYAHRCVFRASIRGHSIIVNEYQPGQGIGAHVDCEPCFGGVVLSISLLSPVVMDFRHRQTKEHVEVLLNPCSMLVMSGEARYDWTHGIAARQADVVNGVKLTRSRRVSITLRTVILAEPASCRIVEQL